MTSIRCQLTRLSLALLGSLFAIIVLLSQTVFLSGYETLEKTQLRNDLRRATEALSLYLEKLDQMVIDWSSWDDTYAYVLDHNAQYITSNLADNNTFTGMDLHMILLLDTNNGVVFSKWVDLETGQEQPLPPELPVAFIPVTSQLQNRPIHEGVQGIIMLTDRPLLIAARPIITSSFSGPPRGTFFMGRLLDKGLINQIKKQTLLDLSVLAGTNDLSVQQPSSFLPLNDSLFQSKQLILDINGNPGFTIEVMTPRSIFQLGRQASTHVTMALLASGIILGIVFFLYGEKGIVRHLVRMSAQADSIANTGNVEQRLEVGGSQELQRMGNAVNNMLASLERAHKEVQERELKFRTVMEQSSDAILLYDPALDQIIDANQTFFRITGYQPEDLSRFSISHFLLMYEKLPPMLRIIRKQQQLHLTNIQCRCKNGAIREMDIASSLLNLNGRTVISSILRDMTERNHEQRMIREMAITDALTGIPNRRHLMERGIQELERLKRLHKRQHAPCLFSCIMLDIDFFKLINDTHGHQCGDMALKELARRLTECVRPYDVIGRYGGEEFAIFLTDTTGDQSMIIAQRVWQKIRSTPFSIGQLTIPVTASLGISYNISFDEGLDDILKRADLALYEAKKNGRDQIALLV